VGNLITNAAKYTYDHGKIEVLLAVDHRTAVLTVNDNGMALRKKCSPGTSNCLCRTRVP
jgi:signal transduction histidine kinase